MSVRKRVIYSVEIMTLIFNRRVLLFMIAMCGFSYEAQAFKWSGNLVLVSDYIGKRGVSLTDGEPALQGEISVKNKQGFYAGIWGSNVDFDDVRAEIDVYAGLNKQVADAWVLGGGIFHYENIGDKSQNFQDIFVNVIYKENTMVRYNYSEDFSGIGDSSNFIEISHSLHFDNGIVLKGNINRQDFKDETVLDDFNIIRLVLEKNISMHKLTLGYSDTDSDNFSGRADAAFYFAYQISW